MIKYIDGDIIKMSDNFEVIGHCSNCFCAMGSGIAPQIKHKFPEAYKVDCETISGDESKMGTITYTKNTKPTTIVNLYGQYGYGRKNGQMDLDYDALRKALRMAKNKFTGKSFGFPKLGSGLAGGSWDIIEQIIEEELKGEDVTVVNYVPQN